MPESNDSEPEKESGGFFQGLKSLIVEDEPEEKQPTAPPPRRAMPAPATPAAAQPPTVPSGNGASNPRIRQVLEAAIQGPAQPALSALNAVMAELVSDLPDETKRISVALKSIKPQGHTPEAIVVDIDECLAELTRKEQQATQAAEAETAQIAAKRQDLNNLDAKITELQQQREALTAEVATADARIAATQRDFLATSGAIRRDLQTLKIKIAPNGAKQ